MPARNPGVIRFWIRFLLGLTLVSLAAWLWQRTQKENRFDPHILEAAQRYSVEPALIKAVIWQESRFNPRARGAAGEIGLMQIRELAAFEWADHEKIHPFHHEQITDPRKNILAGSFYLSKLLKRYRHTDNPMPHALADYNAGRTHVLRWNKGPAQTNSALFLAQMDYPGTRKYALAVLERRNLYEQSLRGRPGR